ncbi:translation initiation factor 2 subunit 2 [Nematocida sp. LUAm3]|nr:translation initiation factor 2 subunit 2 [Nematocida sp. LUAm3]KAI5174092.1 translation initiation factor 2 subunit 2 [Nematocida sp. LUAm2]KAI5177165.1 translation initiation factor 2 subunit 2 [Nematocida sp. LUAm1]
MPYNSIGKSSLEEDISKMHVKEKNEKETNEESESDEDSDFVPVGFDYDGFNTMAEGILHLEKPKEKEEEEVNILSYNALLERIEQHLRPSDGEGEGKLKIPISIKRDGSTKTSLNITEICTILSRDVSHLKQYIEVELSANCSIDGENRLVLKGIFPEAQLQKIIRNYIKQYVTCGICGSLETILEKEEKLLFKKCLTCNASQSVNTIQQGYKALTTKRSVLRRKTGE